MSDQTNPAARLHTVLSKALASGHPATQMLEVWATALEIPPAPLHVCNALMALSNEMSKLRRMVGSLEGVDQMLYLEGLESIDPMLSPMNLPSQKGEPVNHIDSTTLLKLRFCSDLIGKQYQEERLSEADLISIRDALQDLQDTIARSRTLDTALRFSLMRLLEAARQAISLYQISGAAGLKDSLQSILGFVLTDQDSLRKAKVSDKAVLDRLEKLLDKLDKFTSAVTKGYRILNRPVRVLIGFAVDHLSEDDSSPPGESDIPDNVA